MLSHWVKKFQNAFKGIFYGAVGETSFYFHGAAAVAVVLAAWLLNCSTEQWCILLLCIALVMSLELINSSIEHLAKGLCEEQNPHVGKALDIASGGVLIASIFAAIIAAIIFIPQLLALWSST